MITSRRLTAVVAVLMAVALALTGTLVVLAHTAGSVPVSASSSLAYASSLFHKNSIMAVDITVDEDDWDSMLENALSEEYISCDITINGTTYTSVGIRPKGNSSLTTMASSDSDRYSFKVEFDHYVKGQTCQGLDKLVLNNTQSDATYMKEYLSYDLMTYLGVTSSLYSYANITVNGEAWGCYLAIEALEESFALRNYGSSYGQLYKPEGSEMGGGEMGGGPQADGEQPQGGEFPDKQDSTQSGSESSENDQSDGPPGRMGGGQQPPDMDEMPDGESGQSPQGNGSPPSMGQPPDTIGDSAQVGESGQMPGSQDGQAGGSPPGQGGAGGFPGAGKDSQGGMEGGTPGSGSGGGSDLQYIDNNSESYSDIFDNAVFDANESDYQRVIEALEALNSGSDLEKYVNVDQVLRYFAVNTVLVNLDSYVSSMKHNYYLYENNGQISILPWDFNLAFAGFQSNSASSAVNFPIDTPLQGVDLSERPLLGKLLEVDEYKQLYHAYLQQIVTGYFDSGLFEDTIESIDALIGSSVENDPTALYTYEEYTTGVENLLLFGTLRAQSIQGQLDGTIPSTTQGQQQDSSALIDASQVSITAMGTQGGGEMGGVGFGDPGGDAAHAEAEEEPADGTSALPDRETLEQAMNILEESSDGTLTDDQRERLSALGITDEMIEQFQQKAMPAMQNGMAQGGRGGVGRNNPDGQNRTQSATISASTVWIVAGCLAAGIAGVVFVLVFPRRRLVKSKTP